MTAEFSIIYPSSDFYYAEKPASSLLPDTWEEAYILGRAEFLLETLSDYGTVPSGIREQILEQKNDSQIHRWFHLARQVRSLEEFINRM